MIPREHIFLLALLATVLVTSATDLSSYDNNDWVPITNIHDRSIDTKATSRILSEDSSARTKKSSNDQYLREVSPPATRQFHAQPNSIQHHQPQYVPSTFDPQLNQGEIINPFFKQQNFQQQESQRQQPVVLRHNPPVLPTPVDFPPSKPQYMFRQPFPNMNVFHQHHQASPFGFQAPLVSNYSYEKFNPGIQAINQGLSHDTVASSNNNFREPQLQPTPEKPTLPADTVQLVYVPVDSLNQKAQTLQRQPVDQQSNVQFHVLPQAPVSQPQFQRQPQNVLFSQPQSQQPLQFSNPGIDPHKQQQLFSIQNDFAEQALNALNLQLQLQQGHIPTAVHQPIPTTTTTTTTTTPIPITEAPKKRKPHQPPLAVYMGSEGSVSVTDVLHLLKNAKTISVQDTVGPNSPQVFVGPQNLEAPEGYVKFELPYLSALETNRIERKVDQLPFFVAPVGYKAPPGYAKILLPAPHVGSVVVSQKEEGGQQHLDSTVASGENFAGFNEQQTHQFVNTIGEGLHKFNNQIQPSSVTPPTRRVPEFRPLLSQTINQYELEQINNQFVPQFSSSAQDSPSSLLKTSPNQFEQTQPEKISFVTDTSNEFKPVNRGRGSRPHYVTTTRPTTTTEEPPQFVEIETTPQVPETTNRFPSRPTQQQLINQYTVLEQFPVNNKAVQNSEEALHSSVVPTAEFLSQPLRQESDRLPVPVSSVPLPTVSTTKKNIVDYQNQFTPSQNQNQFLDQSHILNPTAPSELINGPLIDPTYQINNQYNPNNHHTSHKLVQQLQQEEQTKIYEEQPLQHASIQNKFAPRPHFVSEEVQNSYEAVDDYKLPAQLPTIHPGIHTLINDLQDQSIRPLLVPASIAPTPEPPSKHRVHQHIEQQDLQQQLQEVSSTETYFITQSSPVTYTTTTEEPTTTRKQRGRQRAHITTTSTPRRNVPRTRRPVVRTTTKRIEYQPDPSEEYNYSPIKIGREQQRAKFHREEYEVTQRSKPHREEYEVTQRSKPHREEYEVTQRSKPHREEYEVTQRSKPHREEYEVTQRSKLHREEYEVTQRPKPHREEYEITQRPTIRSRTRVRGRTTSQPQTTEQSTTEFIIQDNDFKQSQIFSGFQPSKVNPQSYMQFENENVANVQYHNDEHSTEPILITKEISTEPHRMSVDVLINHPIIETVKAEPTIISAPETNSQFVRFSSNLDSGKAEVTTSNSQVRIQGRPRIKSRTRTTERPAPTTTLTYLTTTKKEKQEQEFYGFFRPPNFNAPHQPYNPNIISTTKRPVYISNSIQYEDQPLENSNNVNILANNIVSSTPSFVEELVTRQTTETTEIVTPEPHISRSTPRNRIRNRTRLPKNKPKEEQQNVTPASETRLRSRGKSHFTVPAKIRDNKDEDVEGGNYPKFFPRVESTSPRTKFQITIDPNLGDEDEDQVPFSSIRRQKIIPADQAISSEETNYKSVLNDIPVDRKIVESQEQSADFPVVAHLKNETSDESYSAIRDDVIDEIDKMKKIDESISTTTSKSISETKDSKPKGRRRGVWKLVKRPVEHFETAESQFVGKTVNSLSDDKDSKPVIMPYVTTEDVSIPALETTTPMQVTYSTTKEPSLFETFYKMFEDDNTKDAVFNEDKEDTTVSDSDIQTESYHETTLKSVDSPSTEITLENVEHTTDSSFRETIQPNSETEAWDLLNTSTATEISHETEICFRGKCVKSSDDDKPNV